MAKVIDDAMGHIQTASNLAGVVNWWASKQKIILEHSKMMGIQANNHPVNIMVADKLKSLAGDEFFSACLFVESVVGDDCWVSVQKLKDRTSGGGK